MRYFLLIILFIAFASKIQANNPYAATVKSQAETMERLFMKKDFKAFSKYTYPKVIELMGGEEKTIASLAEGIEQMKKSGITFSGVEIGQPTDAVTEGKEIQCVIPQSLSMKMANGTLIAKASMIGISIDGGKNWTFIDTSGKDLETLRKSLPNISTKLVLPKYPKPQMIPNK